MAGQWAALIPRFPSASYPHPGFRAIHLIHLSNGKLLVIGGAFEGALLVDPISGHWSPVPDTPARIFCCGHCHLADGRVLLAGGDYDFALPAPAPAPKFAHIFDPALLPGNPWIQCDDMHKRRYYPTCMALPDGRALVVSGRRENRPPEQGYHPEEYEPELFTPEGWPDPAPSGGGGSLELLSKLGNYGQAMYSFMHVLPDGNAFLGGPWLGPANRVLRMAGLDPSAWEWDDTGVATPAPPLPQAPRLPPPDPPPPYNPVGVGLSHGSAVMYRPGKILKAGGSSIDSDPGIRGAAYIDLSSTNPPPSSWSLTANPTVKPAYSRAHLNLVVLSDGKVFCVGGCVYGEHCVAANCGGSNQPVCNPTPTPILQAEMWDPDAGVGGAWSDVGGPMTDPRYYHSVAILLRDATVLVAGGNRDIGVCSPSYTVNSGQIFRPPYLDGDPAERPHVTNGPTTIPYGPTVITVNYVPQGVDYEIHRGVLIRLGAVTHSYDMDQRYIAFNPIGTTQFPGTVQFNPNLTATTAPPGPYMLFILHQNASGVMVPCREALYVLVG